MQGIHKGVVTQLKAQITALRVSKQNAILLSASHRLRLFGNFHAMYGIVGVHCVCHRFALVLTDCLNKGLVPPEPVLLLRKAYEYFCKSGMRKRNLKKFVKEVNLERKEAANRGAPGAGVIEDPDDDLHRIIRLECARVKLPKKVVLTRWLGCELCVNVMIGARDAYVRYFKWEAEIKATDSRDVDKSKAIFLRDQLVDNGTFVWFYFLADIIPILTRMNVLFQATLPLPHLLYEKVQGAKDEIKFMFGQEPRDDILSTADLDADTRFGPATESFFNGCQAGRQKYGERGGVLRPHEISDLKEKMLLCAHFMLENLSERFPHEDLYVYEILRVVDPRLRRRPKLGKRTHADCVRALLHVFEIPLHGFIEPKKVLQSHGAFITSVSAADILGQCFVLDANGNHAEEQIYEYYYELAKLGGETYEWCKFSLFCLIVATGNAISERGFSAMAAVHGKSRSELGLPHVLASMLVAFNGASYKDFCEQINKDSISQGKKWWGYVDRRGERFNQSS